MIIDQIENLLDYQTQHPLILKIDHFLRYEKWQLLSPGRYTLDGEKLFAIIEESQGKGREGACLESHKRYIDLQMCADGSDLIGWSPVNQCQEPIGTYCSTKDILFYRDLPQLWVPVDTTQFVWLNPNDAHAPLGAKTPMRKLIFKIAVDWN